jgi:osmotically inducible protein OsmC
MQRTASAQWNGGLKDGKGSVTTQSGVLKQSPYSFSTRFENQPGTNPEELIAAAHAGCFTMALSAQLEGAGMRPEQVNTDAKVTMEKLEGGWTITAIHLDTKARIPGADLAKFQEIATKAKEGCPVSRVLNAKITMNASLA